MEVSFRALDARSVCFALLHFTGDALPIERRAAQDFGSERLGFMRGVVVQAAMRPAARNTKQSRRFI